MAKKSSRKDNNIVRFRQPFRLNIGVVVFVIIFIYLIFNVYSYLTSTRISAYEVVQGSIAVDNTYRGLILREEEVYTSPYSGALNYYVREGAKVSYGNLVCSVDEGGSVSGMIAQESANGGALDDETMNELSEDIMDFRESFDAMDFPTIYSFKDELEGELEEAINLSALNNISTYAEQAAESGSFHKMTADTHGIVAYYTDGFENVTVDNFTADMFDESVYEKSSTKLDSSISKGDAAYKLVTSEEWNIVIPIGQDLSEQLVDGDTIEIRFAKDDKTTYATYEIIRKAGQDYLVLSLKHSMIRYVKDRYIDVELVMSAETGLKIPNSAITEKEFFTIPIGYFTNGGDSDDLGLIVEHTDDDGNKTTSFVTPTVYYETDEYYYIDSESVSAGDVVRMTNSSRTYLVGSTTDSLLGAYNINKGYAVFKQIHILYQNEEYAIIETGTSYGLSLYDHIALDATKISENELIQ